jgi:hypothetical protein
MDEVSYALDVGKTIFPVLVEECDVSFRLRRLQFIDFTAGYEKGLARLLTALGVDGQELPKPPAIDKTDMRQITATVESPQRTLSTELDERIKRVIKDDVPVLAGPTDTPTHPSEFLRLINISRPLVLTLLICAVLDGATFVGLRITATATLLGEFTDAGAPIYDVVHIYIFWALVAHGVIAAGSGIIT